MDASSTCLGDRVGQRSGRAAGALLALAVLTLSACNALIPNRLQAGGSFLYTLDPAPGLGFGSTLAGPDAERGSVSFALCAPDARLCDTATRGFALETQFVTRVGADPFSPAGLSGRVEAPHLGLSSPLPGTVMAVVRVPRRADGGPPPGRYRVEARVTTNGRTRDLLGGAGAGLEIVPGDAASALSY